MLAVDQGIVEVDEAFAGIIDFCLGCRACEPVCPGLVPYGRALEGARAEIAAQLPGRGKERRWQLGTALGSRGLLRTGTFFLSLSQVLGMTGLAPEKYRRLTSGLRRLSQRPRAVVGHSGGSGDAGTVGLLTGCVQDQWFRPVNEAAVRLLEMAGHRVEAPKTQTCCGALSAHDGKARAAHQFAATNAKVFSGYDTVVATSAGCSAHLAGYGHWAEGGEQVGKAALDITVVVARAIEDARLPRSQTERGPIAIQDPCHLRHAQRVTKEPRLILAAAGYDVVETDPNGMCCGAAGIYTITQPEASEKLGNQKADQVRSTGVDRVASANPGCEMQLRSYLDDNHVVAHPIEWYLRAIEEDLKG